PQLDIASYGNWLTSLDLSGVSGVLEEPEVTSPSGAAIDRSISRPNDLLNPIPLRNGTEKFTYNSSPLTTLPLRGNNSLTASSAPSILPRSLHGNPPLAIDNFRTSKSTRDGSRVCETEDIIAEICDS